MIDYHLPAIGDEWQMTRGGLQEMGNKQTRPTPMIRVRDINNLRWLLLTQDDLKWLKTTFNDLKRPKMTEMTTLTYLT